MSPLDPSNLDDPRVLGLLQFGLGMMKAGGPSRMPQSFLGNFGTAGEGAIAQMQAARQMQMQMADRAAQKRLQDAQISNLDSEVSHRKFQEQQAADLAAAEARDRALENNGILRPPQIATPMAERTPFAVPINPTTSLGGGGGVAGGGAGFGATGSPALSAFRPPEQKPDISNPPEEVIGKGNTEAAMAYKEYLRLTGLANAATSTKGKAEYRERAKDQFSKFSEFARQEDAIKSREANAQTTKEVAIGSDRSGNDLYQTMQWNRETKAFDIPIGKEHKATSGMTVNLPPQERAEQNTVGKFMGESFGDIIKNSQKADARASKFLRLNQLLDGVNTGKLTPIGTTIATYAKSVGYDIDPNLGNKQAAEVLSAEMALEARNTAEGGGMPGAMSDLDRDFLRSMIPGIEKTPEGRRLITETVKKLAERHRKLMRMAIDYRKKHGTFDEGFFIEASDYNQENPIFSGMKPVETGLAEGWSGGERGK